MNTLFNEKEIYSKPEIELILLDMDTDIMGVSATDMNEPEMNSEDLSEKTGFWGR